MLLFRTGKCDTCLIPIKVQKDFVETVDMFAPEDNSIKGDLAERIRAWRDEPIYCEEHI